MELKERTLHKLMVAYLARRSVPQSMADNDEAKADEVSALLRAAAKFAPDQRIDEWWWSVEEKLDVTNKTRVWPNVYEIYEAAKASTPAANKVGTQGGDRAKLTSMELVTLEDKVLPTARRWLAMGGLHQHGRQTLEFWGEKV